MTRDLVEGGLKQIGGVARVLWARALRDDEGLLAGRRASAAGAIQAQCAILKRQVERKLVNVRRAHG